MKEGEPTQTVTSHRAVICLTALVSGVLLGWAFSAGVDARWVLLDSIALFGLAYGAGDLWLPGQTMPWRSKAVFCLAYLALAGGILLLWQAQLNVALARWVPLAS